MSGEIANFLGENRALVLLIAFLGDAIVGGRRGLAWLPGPDGLIASIVGLFSGRLDRISRDSSTRMVRGTAVALILAAIGFFAGWAIERWAAASAPGALVIVVLIGLVIGQRYALDTTLELARRLARDRNPSEAGHYGVARWCVERMANRFADGMIANSLFFLAFGLGGLFAYRVLANLVARGAPKGVLMPESPYYRWPARLYRWITLPAGATSALAVWLATRETERSMPLRSRAERSTGNASPRKRMIAVRPAWSMIQPDCGHMSSRSCGGGCIEFSGTCNCAGNQRT